MKKEDGFSFAMHAKDGSFDSHIDNSIRGYSNMIDDVISMSRYFVENDTSVIDIGCTTGRVIDTMATINNDFAPRAKYIGIEIEENFRKAQQNNSTNSNVEYFIEDVRKFNFNEHWPVSLVTSIFTLQFMPIKDRHDIIAKIYEVLQPGGAFIFTEKVYACDPQVQDMLTFMFYSEKKKYFTEEEILSKEMNLRNILKPNTTSELMDMMKLAGFKSINQFWQNFLFKGWICIK